MAARALNRAAIEAINGPMRAAAEALGLRVVGPTPADDTSSPTWASVLIARLGLVPRTD